MNTYLYDANFGSVATRAELRTKLGALAGDRTLFDKTAAAVAASTRNDLDAFGIVSFNNRNTWDLRSQVPAVVARKLTPRARQFDLQEQVARARQPINDVAEWQRDFGLLAMLAKKQHGGCCDDLAALAFCHIVATYPKCAVFVIQVGITHSLVVVIGTDLEPWVIDKWTNTFAPLNKFATNRICDLNLRVHCGLIDQTAPAQDLTLEWEDEKRLADVVSSDLPGPRESQVNDEGYCRTRNG